MYEVKVGERSYRIAIEEGEEAYTISVGEAVYRVDAAQPSAALYSLIIEGKSYRCQVHREGDHCSVWIGGKVFVVELVDERDKAARSRQRHQVVEGEQKVVSSMPGKVISILAQIGQHVKRGDGLIIVQAMKMENELKSPKDGEIKEICIREGQKVEGGEVLLVIG